MGYSKGKDLIIGGVLVGVMISAAGCFYSPHRDYYRSHSDGEYSRKYDWYDYPRTDRESRRRDDREDYYHRYSRDDDYRR